MEKTENESSTTTQRLLNYYNVLRNDGLSYGDYVEQLTYLLFLKMADEQTRPPFNKPSVISSDNDWNSLSKLDGDALETQYRKTLENLGREKGMLGIIFRKSQNKIQAPARLKRLIELINGETWSETDFDVKSGIYEGLLRKNAENVKSGAGQYFTPYPLVESIVKVMRPSPEMVICDPACGMGGFILAAHEYISTNYNLDKAQEQLRFKGWEIEDATARLCAINLYLHGIGGDESSIVVADALISDPGDRFEMVLTNPPFGKKTIVNGEGRAARDSLTYEREDFWAATSNKQMNFLQHVKTLLKINGRAAIVVPDNVLFEGGAGETVRKRLLHECDVHTLLRLPTGVFHAQAVKANVLFFDRKPHSETPWTKELWIYDLRTNKHFTLKSNPLTDEDLEDFFRCYNPENRHQRKETDRFHKFTYDELMKRDKLSLDIFWLKDESLEDTENLQAPDILAKEIIENLEDALDRFNVISKELEAK